MNRHGPPTKPAPTTAPKKGKTTAICPKCEGRGCPQGRQPMTDDPHAEHDADRDFEMICDYFTVREIVRLAVDYPDFYDELKREAGVNEDIRVAGIPGRNA